MDGVLKKLESLENLILNANPAVIFLQETQVKRSGRIKTPSSAKYTWYELNRTPKAPKGQNGGGVAIGVQNGLEPSWISEGDDDSETITVEIWIEGFPIRLICGYGPQETDKKERKDKFWKYCNSEVQSAKEDGAAVILQIDGNLWAGKGIIKDDPKTQNSNGKRFEDFLMKNPHLTVVNALPCCEGLYTRVKRTKKGEQKTVIDFFVVCNQILPLITKMTIDEKGDTTLTRYKGKVVKSDHRSLKLEVNLVFHEKSKQERTEIFNLKNKDCQSRFYQFGSKDQRFSKCFLTDDETIHVQFKRWKRKFDKAIVACFQKIRVTNKVKEKKSPIDELMNEKKFILKKSKVTMEDLRKVDEIEKRITKEIEDKEFEKIKKVLGDMETGKGKINSTNIWKEWKKAFPKKTKPIPTGVKNVKGKVITNPKEKKKVTLAHFKHRMRKRPVKENVLEEIEENNKLFNKRLEESKKKKSPPFDMNELQDVLNSLKTGKSKDPDDYIREIFKDGVLGEDMKISILMMMNRMKEQNTMPAALKRANITILHKKSCKLDLNNWRGVFVSSVLRIILMKLIHERTYPKVDSNMTDAQIGARRNKSVRNHIFILNSIISDVMSSSKKEPIELQIMDYKQMFDAEELKTAMNAFYEAGINDDMFALINEANNSNTIAVKTPNGITETVEIKNKLMQGDVLAPLMSSNMVDINICKKAMVTGNVYMYKGKVEIPPLAMQDDTLGITTCGDKAIQMNKFLNKQTNRMQLQYGTDKCVKMHIGKKHNSETCPDLYVDSWTEIVTKTEEEKEEVLKDEFNGKETMKNVDEKKYLGNILSKNMKNQPNIKDRTGKAVGNVNKIISGLYERPYGRYTYRAAKIMREAMLIGPMVNNSEVWFNVTKEDLNNLEKPDTMLQRQLLTKIGNPCKVFMCLELGLVPVTFVIMGNRLKYLNTILRENTNSMLRQVYDEQKADSCKGDFVDQVSKDMKELNINLTEKEIGSITKYVWKDFVDKTIKQAALKYLTEENSRMEKTKEIKFEELKMSDYLFENKQMSLTKIIFNIRSGTLDIKSWNPWKYKDLWCVGCGTEQEDMSHFVICKSYGESTQYENWKDIFTSDVNLQNQIAQNVRQRLEMRATILEADEAGQDSTPGSNAPFVC